MDIPSLLISHFPTCCCECTLSMFTPIINILNFYWIPLLAVAAAYSWDCDPLDHHSHDSKGLHTIGCLPHIYIQLHITALGDSLG